MPKQKTDDLLQLISGLNRAEKRHFRLFVKRNQQAANDILFLQLFDYLEKHGEYDEDHLRKRITGIKKSQLSNLKAHLYKQLLISLRLLNKNKDEEIVLREQADFARILYNKGLYRQALDVLNKAKLRARDREFHTQALELAEFEKLIEGQYITRSIRGRAEELSDECSELSAYVRTTNDWSDFHLRLYGAFLKSGLVRDEEEAESKRNFFEELLPESDYDELDFWGKVFYHQAYQRLHYLTQNFPQAYRSAYRWVELFEQRPEMIQYNAPLYLKGLHQLLVVCFNLQRYDRFETWYKVLLDFPEVYDFSNDTNVEGIYQLSYYNHALMGHFLTGTFDEGLALIPELNAIMEDNRYNWDDLRLLLFQYRIACTYFGAGDNDSAVDYLNEIINQRGPDNRSDIQAFARILNLIAHFELGNVQLVEYQVKSVYRFLSKMDDLQPAQQAIFRFLRRVPRIREEDLREAFIELRDHLNQIAEQPYLRRPFMYLDIIGWLTSKIEGIPVQQVIRRRFAEQRAAYID